MPKEEAIDPDIDLRFRDYYTFKGGVLFAIAGLLVVQRRRPALGR